MMKTTWLLAALAACGDNAAGPLDDGDAAPLPTYRVDGMPPSGPPAIACDTRITIASGVYDCATVLVEPGHYKTTCPMESHASVLSEIWYDDQWRPTRESFTSAELHVFTTIYTYDDVGLHERTMVDEHGRQTQHWLLLSRNDAGNPTAVTEELDFPAGVLTDTFVYDDLDRLTDETTSFSDGSLFNDFSVRYDDAALHEVISIYFAAFPGSGPASTGGFDILFDDLGRYAKITAGGSRPNTTTYSYDDAGRTSHVVYTDATGVTISDLFYDCR